MALEQLDLFGYEALQPVKAKPVVVKPIKLKEKNKRGRKSYKEMYNSADLINIPDDETLDKKLYYSISEVAEWFKVSPSLLRFWESAFDILQPRKNKKGDRLFKKEDIKNLELIHYLLRNKKYSIEGAKDYLKNNKNSFTFHQQLIATLNNCKAFLLELKANLNS
jgi:DNA-binding transcriptional MerR regulator